MINIIKKNIQNSFLKSKWNRITIVLIFALVAMVGLIVGLNNFNKPKNLAQASSLDTGFYKIHQVLASPDDQVLYVRGGGNSDGTAGIKKVDANTNTDMGVSVSYTNNTGFDMVLSQDGSKLYLILFNDVKVLNTSDLSLIASINVDSSPSGAKAVLNSDESKLYVGGTNTVNVIYPLHSKHPTT